MALENTSASGCDGEEMADTVGALRGKFDMAATDNGLTPILEVPSWVRLTPSTNT